MSDPLFDTYQAYRLSTLDAPVAGMPRPGGGPGCGCAAATLSLTFVGAAIGIACMLLH